MHFLDPRKSQNVSGIFFIFFLTILPKIQVDLELQGGILPLSGPLTLADQMGWKSSAGAKKYEKT